MKSKRRRFQELAKRAVGRQRRLADARERTLANDENQAATGNGQLIQAEQPVPETPLILEERELDVQRDGSRQAGDDVRDQDAQ
jgi:hypothetical protein